MQRTIEHQLKQQVEIRLSKLNMHLKLECQVVYMIMSMTNQKIVMQIIVKANMTENALINQEDKNKINKLINMILQQDLIMDLKNLQPIQKVTMIAMR